MATTGKLEPGAGRTVLVVDDEPAMVEVLRTYLEAEGYSVLSAGDGVTALQLAASGQVDMVLLDVMLPGLDGREVCARLRGHSDVPIIMLTARGDEVDRVVGLELGADDYITKPFSPREVAARVRAVLRRARRRTGPMPTRSSVPTEGPGEVIQAGSLVVDVGHHRITLDGRELDLTPTEFRLLATLAAHPGRVFTRMQLVEHLQGMAFEGYERTIDVHVKNLRQKLGDDPKHPRFIGTVYGVGYKLLQEGSAP